MSKTSEEMERMDLSELYTASTEREEFDGLF